MHDELDEGRGEKGIVKDYSNKRKVRKTEPYQELALYFLPVVFPTNA